MGGDRKKLSYLFKKKIIRNLLRNFLSYLCGIEVSYDFKSLTRPTFLSEIQDNIGEQIQFTLIPRARLPCEKTQRHPLNIEKCTNLSESTK